MALIGKKHHSFLPHKTVGKLAAVALLVTLSASIIDTIWAVYLDSFFNNTAYVGLFSGFLTFFSFISFFWLIPIIEKGKKEILFIYSMVLIIISYVFFAFINNLFLLFLISLVSILAVNLRISVFGIIVNDKSKRSKLAKNEGLLYTIYNTGWLIGPFIAGFIAARFGFSWVFFTAALVAFLAMLGFIHFHIKDHNEKKKVDKNLLKNFVDFFKSKERTIAYFLGGGVNFWWTLIYLFIPLMLFEKGFDIRFISIFLFIIAIPNILCTYPFASLANKIGFKKLFILGYLILTVSALICFFLTNIYLILIVLIISIIGAAMIESTTESYFLDILKGKEVYRFYPPYNTTIDVNHFVARIIPSLIILVLPFKFIFLFFSISMFFFVLLSFYTRRIIESKKNN